MNYDKIFLIGFPKSGTSTIQKALTKSGVRSAHWSVKEGFVGDLMYKGLQKHDDPWFYLKQYTAITQSDVCIDIKDSNRLRHLSAKQITELKSRHDKYINYWPNLDFTLIKKIYVKYPRCLFILNYRNPKKIVKSISKWTNLQQRLKNNIIPGLPKGKGNDSELKLWIERHYDAVRTHFENKDNFIELDIENTDAPKILGDKLGLKIKWWGCENSSAVSNKPTLLSQKEFDLFQLIIQDCKEYFEYGLGGSTVFVHDNSHAQIKGVDTSKEWVTKVKNSITSKNRIDLKHTFIGKVGKWGKPENTFFKLFYPNYPQSISSIANKPDVIFIDGRFRVACAAQVVMFCIKRNISPKILLHDSVREDYVPIYDILIPVKNVKSNYSNQGGLQVFKINKKVDLSKVKQIYNAFKYNPA